MERPGIVYAQAEADLASGGWWRHSDRVKNRTAALEPDGALSFRRLAQGLPLIFVAGWRDNIAHNFYRVFHRAKSVPRAWLRRHRHDFRYGFSESDNADRLPRPLHLLEQREAIGPELRDGDFFHRLTIS